MTGLTHQQRRDKHDATTAVAIRIISAQQQASLDKTARLKALRLARDGQRKTPPPTR